MRASGVTPQFQAPSRQAPSRRMWIIVVLCLLLPPVGLILLWTSARNPLRGKLVISLIALLSMTLMLTIYLTQRMPNPYQLQTPADYEQLLQLQQLQQQQLVSPMDQMQNAPLEAQTETQAQPEAPQDDPVELVPANPLQ